MQTWTIQVAGATCDRCEAALRHELSQIDGIESLTIKQVSHRMSTVTMRAQHRPEDTVMTSAVAEAGLSVVTT